MCLAKKDTLLQGGTCRFNLSEPPSFFFVTVILRHAAGHRTNTEALLNPVSLFARGHSQGIQALNE